MRRKDPQTEPRRQQQIIEAALTLSVIRGFHAASMRDIAAEAGLSPALIYRYFRNKEAIIVAVVKEDTDAFARRIAALGTGEITAATLRRFLQDEIAQRADPDTFRITAEIVAEAARSPDVARVITANMTAAEADLGALLNRMHPGASRRAATIIALVDHLAAHRYFGLPSLPDDPFEFLDEGF